MRLSKNDVICGLPAESARQLMRDYSHRKRTAHLAAETLGTDLGAAIDQLRAFEHSGFIERAGDNSDGALWITTVQGNALAMASFARPIKRATAERLLAAAVERVRGYNADPAHLFTITQLVVFGSYLDPDAAELGDLDLAISIVRRESDAVSFAAAARAYTAASGRTFGTVLAQLFWPRHELAMIVKGGKRAISLTDEDVSTLTDRSEIVYSVAGDLGAIQPPTDAVAQHLT